jgi:hypothetical protein
MTVSTPEEMLERIEGILTCSQNGSHGPVVEQKFALVHERIGDLRAALTDLSGLVVLQCAPSEDDRMTAARHIWENLSGGVASTDVAELIAESPTLSALARSAVQVKSVQPFSAEQIRVARILGREVADRAHYVGLLARKAHEDGFRIDLAHVPNMLVVLRELHRAKLIEGFHVEFSFKPGDRAEWRELRGGKLPEQTQAARVVRGTVAPDAVSFLSGHWLTAYAYWIVRDQFTNAGVPFEVYTNVVYDLPDDLGGGRSDIDVLVRSSKLILAIEVKSGWLLKEQHGVTQAAKTAENAERFERVASRLDLGIERRHLLLHTGRKEEPDAAIAAAIESAAPGIEVQPVVPTAMRGEVQKLSAA